MSQKILIVGAGFAGVWGALGAARVLDRAGVTSGDIEITLISPKPELQIRPRLYEREPQRMAAPLLPLLDAVGVKFFEGCVEAISVQEKTASVACADGQKRLLAYDRLLLTSGSALSRPPVPGLAEHAFSVDRIEDAVALDDHFAALATLPDSPARNTVAVVGCGFTGIEVATELPGRLRERFGPDAACRVVVIGAQDEIGPDLGPNPRPHVADAFDSLGVETVLGSRVVSVAADGVRTASGTHVEAMTVIWAGGMRASPLTAQVSSNLDQLGRVEVTPDLRVAEAPHVFVAGDVARARSDDDGHYALMSCQHAIVMGQFGGYNVAADLIGVPTLEYRQPFYATCVDLGEWGAVYSEGWDRQIKLTHAEGKVRKQMINTQWIYPPAPNRAEALAAGDPLASFG
ncbi:MAG: FAD-dependent oxidoreductase [Burkholderia sp.]|jgi:NADH dehydrogenase|uniref:NAD(P)/FAD-dependent oxidoreductase n=2 Tax=Burkholderiaceae TaxID=119060 RepID=UPI001CF20937|nr:MULTISPECIES: FAD-dependent oxidoreductase [Burkholderia]MCA3782034.1 FAD-dependent oxidoreductase [Burkholderia sp.]MCA3783642.1 FAD-dependent oxidoreductase [Burkholderia sp.]MCA3796958.1 FAD-dependent oxidoreductase [Burkholderia sp.]MCA3805699.1 FAD-dependent oxidoreductase [Burkholderia sp.]MCA3810774.1 FAD-dependent oxidoreductase [Burkholderia sp.]